MFDQSTPRGKILVAALDLAAQRPWRDIGLADIAHGAGMGLVDLRPHFGSKSQIVAAVMRVVDDETLRRLPVAAEGQSHRDRLFDVIMTRFDVLAAYKASIRSIADAGQVDSTLLMPFLNSQRWMLAAAGVDADGPLGIVRVLGTGSVYRSVFETWIDDTDPGMARTMAALDQRLRRGERAMSMVTDACTSLERLTRTIGAAACSLTRSSRAPSPAPSEPRNAASS